MHISRAVLKMPCSFNMLSGYVINSLSHQTRPFLNTSLSWGKWTTAQPCNSRGWDVPVNITSSVGYLTLRPLTFQAQTPTMQSFTCYFPLITPIFAVWGAFLIHDLTTLVKYTTLLTNNLTRQSIDPHFLVTVDLHMFAIMYNIMYI